MTADCPHGDSDPALCPPCQGAAMPHPIVTDRRWSFAFRARYDGRCVGCEHPICEGDAIRMTLDDERTLYVHDGCEAT